MFAAIYLVGATSAFLPEHPKLSAKETPVSLAALDHIENIVNPKPTPKPDFDRDVLVPLHAAQAAAEAKRQAEAKAQAERQAQAALRQRQAPATIANSPTPVYATSDSLALGQQMAAARGWTGAEWDALYKLWMRESGWNPGALNASSGACGIPQALPCSKISDHSPAGQIAWGLDYIAGRYGNPLVAWAHSQATGWY